MVKNGSRSLHKGNPMYNKRGEIGAIKDKAFLIELL